MNFKKNDRVLSDCYGLGIVLEVNPDYKWKHKGRDKKKVHCIGSIEVKFDEQDEDDSPLTYTLDGRTVPVGTGYFSNGEFNEFGSDIELTKI